MHREFGFPPDARCKGCGKRPSIRAIMLAPVDEVMKRGMLPPGIDRAAMHQIIVPIRENPTDKKGVPYARLSVTYSCDACSKELEKALAKAPSWMVVDIGRGPDHTNKVQIGAGD